MPYRRFEAHGEPLIGTLPIQHQEPGDQPSDDESESSPEWEEEVSQMTGGGSGG